MKKKNIRILGKIQNEIFLDTSLWCFIQFASGYKDKIDIKSNLFYTFQTSVFFSQFKIIVLFSHGNYSIYLRNAHKKNSVRTSSFHQKIIKKVIKNCRTIFLKKKWIYFCIFLWCSSPAKGTGPLLPRPTWSFVGVFSHFKGRGREKNFLILRRMQSFFFFFFVNIDDCWSASKKLHRLN